MTKSAREGGRVLLSLSPLLTNQLSSSLFNLPHGFSLEKLFIMSETPLPKGERRERASYSLAEAAPDS